MESLKGIQFTFPIFCLGSGREPTFMFKKNEKTKLMEVQEPLNLENNPWLSKSLI